MLKPYTVASFFSGCGGLDLGLEGGFEVPSACVSDPVMYTSEYNNKKMLIKTGLHTVFACDIKKSAENVWNTNFKRKDAFKHESIVDLIKKAKEGTFMFPEADIVTGGFPCQDFSLAGKRKGFNSTTSHKNSTLANEAPSIESRGMLYYWLREAIAIINPKIFIAENVKGLISLNDAAEIITNDFRSINGGYFVITPKVLHAGDYGVPQNRERVIFIGIRKDLLSESFLQEIQSGYFDIYPKPSHSVKDKVWVSAFEAVSDLPEPSESIDPSQKAYSKAKWYGKHCQGQTEIGLNKLGPTIRSEHHGNIEFRRLSEEHGGAIKSEFHLPERRLTVRECARIQTFPDSFQFVIPNLCSASDAYKLVGNAVPPLLAFHIALKVLEILERLNHA